MMLVAIACAVLAAGCSALGAQLQHTGVRTETSGGALRLTALGKLARNRFWLRGFFVLVACAVLQILALTFAPVSVVAPIVALALPMVALLNARAGRVPLDPPAWIMMVATVLAVAVFVSLSASQVTEQDISPAAVLLASQVVAVGVGVLGLVALVSTGIGRCVAVATAAGAAYGLVAVLVRDVAYTVRTDGFGELPVLSAIGLVAAFLIGSWLIQLGYASGPPDIVVGAQTVLNPVTATAIGMTLLGEGSTLPNGILATLAVCGGVAIAGVLVLASHHPEAARRMNRAEMPAPASGGPQSH